jgi:predicted nucleic acid-binding protein
MIYLDSSVALAHLFTEDRFPSELLWEEDLVSSRLLEYEVWNRIYARGFGDSHGQQARNLLAEVALIELSPLVLERALEPFPTRVRTLDSLHLASIEFLRVAGHRIRLASYDDRLITCARKLGIDLVDP